MLLDAYAVKLEALLADIRNKNYEVYTWQNAEDKNPDATNDLLKGDIPLGDVFVLFVDNAPQHYIKMKDHKIQSLTPMVNEETIVGWL